MMNPQDVINILIEQRNTAMNELALTKAEVVTLKRNLDAAMAEKEVVHIQTEPLEQQMP